MEAFALQGAPVLKTADMTDDVARAAKRDVSAFERVYHAHLPWVHMLLWALAAVPSADRRDRARVTWTRLAIDNYAGEVVIHT